MRILTALVLVLFSASPRASAGELAYRWTTDEVMHYRVQAFVVAPSVLRFMAARNVTARAEDVALALELDCKADPPKSAPVPGTAPPTRWSWEARPGRENRKN